MEDGEIIWGVDAYPECWDGEAWSPRFTLFTDCGGHGPVSVLYGPRLIVGLGLLGPGPEAHVLPAQLEPGWYRIRKRGEGRDLVGYLQVQ